MFSVAVRKRQEVELEAVEIKYLIPSILTRTGGIRNECMVHMVDV